MLASAVQAAFARVSASSHYAAFVAGGVADARTERVVETGGVYVPGHPVVVRIRARGRRLDLDDRGAAVALAGRPRGWLTAAERVVAESGMNVNRAGVVFVSAVAGRDVDKLARRLGETSRAVYIELLKLD
jgi:hypothetical protein